MLLNCIPYRGGANRVQKACIAQLIDACGKLEVVNGRTLTSTPSGKEDCLAFLKHLEVACEALNVEYASRGYRASFTSNYKVLFPADSRNYNFDLFKASVEKQHTIYVNGDKFEFSATTITSAERLQEAMRALHDVLKPSLLACQGRHAVEEVRSLLTSFDASWAYFEKSYIVELVNIEAKARSFVLNAIRQEQLLVKAEESKDSIGGVQQRRKELVASICRLNSIANVRGKGRDDLDVGILEDAIALQSQDHLRTATNSNAALVLARDVTMSFDAIRDYLRHASKMGVLERIDPNLSNNAGLVERLVTWEESWEIGRKYVRNMPLFSAVSDVVSELQRVQDVAPRLKEMCEDCDVELFFCIPRIIWLRFLAEPMECGELLKELLPHRFATTTQTSADCQSHPSGRHSLAGELRSLRDSYLKICQELERIRLASSLPASTLTSAARELLTRRAITGTGGAQELYDFLLPSGSEGSGIKLAIEGLMLELEGWSMELQRHSPEDWNRCSSLLVQCLQGESEKPVLEFHV